MSRRYMVSIVRAIGQHHPPIIIGFAREVSRTQVMAWRQTEEYFHERVQRHSEILLMASVILSASAKDAHQLGLNTIRLLTLADQDYELSSVRKPSCPLMKWPRSVLKWHNHQHGFRRALDGCGHIPVL
jgi:hypothetical protein